MLLCDRIARTNNSALTDNDIRTAVAVDRALAEKVRNCPVRYVLSENVHDAVAEASQRQPDVLCTGLPFLRVPHTRFWLEWIEPRRHTAGGKPSRAGLLVESDPTGRFGTLTSVWMDGEEGPYRAPAHFNFAFDKQISDGLEPYAVDRSDRLLYAFFDGLFKHAAFSADPVWLDGLQRRAGPARLQVALNRLFAVNVRDFPLLCSFLLLLMQPRVLDARESDLSALNKARARKGAAPLLDHVELHMRLSAAARAQAAAANDNRESARRHWVRGHFVSRDDKVYWRRNHMRGDAARGFVSTKTLHVER